MAPRKRKTAELEHPKTVSSRVTRSSTASRLNNPVNSVSVASTKLESPKKKAKKEPRATSAGVSPATKAKSPAKVKTVDNGSKNIIIEHCKQCQQFKKRAVLVKDALEKDVSGITVLVNPEKPRRGCFEIREEGGETFISLLDMKRPFEPMKALDMDEVISNIIDKIK